MAKGTQEKTEETLPLFAGDGHAPPPAPYAAANADRLRQWAARGIFFGTSSWKYPGWKGMVYTRSYPSKRDFEQECLAEYATIFPTVCADFALYDFPKPLQMKAIHESDAGTLHGLVQGHGPHHDQTLSEPAAARRECRRR